MDEEVGDPVPPAPRQQFKVSLHPGSQYVGSLEPQSLQTLTYLKLASCTSRVTLSTTCYSRTPVLYGGDAQPSINTSYDIIGYLKEQGCDIDQDLTAQQKSEILAYSDLLTDRLLPAVLYMQWLDAETYLNVTRKNYSAHLTFPLSLFYLSSQHKTVEHLIMRDAPQESNPDQRKMQLVGRATEAIFLLSSRLGGGMYFYGDKPTSLDALVFGYLEIIAQGPVHGDNALHTTLVSCNNLCNFCSRIRTEYFPNVKERMPSKPAEAKRATTLWKDPLFLVSMGVALLALGLQGVRVGLFSRVTPR